ncbi:MAG: hypothetical protein WC718_04700, partial [Phycisphaerales bacterium]
MLASAVAASLLAPAALGQMIIPVFPLPGGTSVRVSGLNSFGTGSGVNVVGYSDNAAGQDRAINWTSTGGTTSIGLLPGGTINSYAQAINYDKTTIVGYGDSGGSTRAFRWTTTGGYTIIPLVPGTGNFNQAFAMNQGGGIVTGVSGIGAGARAFRWDYSTPASIINLGVLPGQNSSSGLAVSGDASTIVGTSGSRAFRWLLSTGAMTDLGALPGQVWAMGEAVNYDGTVVTGRYSTGGNEFGYRWTTTTGMVALPQTLAGCSALRPRSVTSDGNTIVGQVVDNAAGFTAFIWTPINGTELLATHLAARGVDLTGWQITDATGISLEGTALCGNGYYYGQPAGWLVRQLKCPPQIIWGPSALSGCIGSTLNFNAGNIVGFTAPLQWRWFKNGVQISDGPQPTGSVVTGALTSTMAYHNFSPGDGGTYTVHASAQGACEVTTYDGQIFDPYESRPFDEQPVDTAVCAGQAACAYVQVSQYGPAVTYQWQKFVGPGHNDYVNIYDGPSGNGSNYSGQGTQIFCVFPAQPADTNRYRCLITDPSCVTPTPSNSALLTINPSAPIVTIPPEFGACQGDNDAEVTITSAPAGPTTFQWQAAIPAGSNTFVNIANGFVGNGSSYGGVTTSTLTISGIYAGLSDQYRCVVTGPCGGTTISPVTLFRPWGNPTLIGPVNTEQCLGDNDAFFICTPSPYAPGTTFQWQKFVGPRPTAYANIFNGPTGNGGNYGGTNSPTLSINGVYYGDLRNYRCVVTDPCFGTVVVSAPAELAATPDASIVTQPADTAQCLGD